MIYILIIITLIAGYSIYRYVSLVFSLRQIGNQIDEIKKELSQNQILHLPQPNHDLGKVIASFNDLLESIRQEKITYEKKEKSFRQQIENISHDLRTPLTVILGYLKLYKINLSSSDEEIESFKIIEQKSQSLKNLIDQFYDYSRINAKEYNLNLTDIDVIKILKECFLGNYMLLEQNNLKVEVNIPDRPLWIRGDYDALERIFLNLFQNGARYSKSFFEIQVIEEVDSVSVLFINDTDKLALTDVPLLFDRLYMQNNSRNQGGTGLGLTIAKSLAEELNGSLTVEVIDSSQENMVISFTFKMNKVIL